MNQKTTTKKSQHPNLNLKSGNEEVDEILIIILDQYILN